MDNIAGNIGLIVLPVTALVIALFCLRKDIKKSVGFWVILSFIAALFGVFCLLFFNLLTGIGLTLIGIYLAIIARIIQAAQNKDDNPQ